MVRTASTMLTLGTKLPDFNLPLVEGTNNNCSFSQRNSGMVSSNDLVKKPLLILIICAHCPFVKHLEEEFSKLDSDYSTLVQILAVSSNSLITHPQDGPEYLKMQAKRNKWSFPYLFDEDQGFAKALKAACTPDVFLFSPQVSGEQILRYRGQLDESRPGNKIPVTGSDLRHALETVIRGDSILKEQKPSIGCNIKWHPGQEPDWFG